MPVAFDPSEPPADEFRRRVRRRTGLRPEQLVCPREQSAMTPCIARDGQLAVAESVYGDVCVGCDRTVQSLLDAERSRRPPGDDV